MGDRSLPGYLVAMRVLLISHEPQAAPGRIGRLLAERGVQTHLHVVLEDPQHPNTDFPDPDDFDAVIAFGSFANAHDPKARNWVEPEVEYIRGLSNRAKPYLGVCFGGQLLAEALGGKVVPAGSQASEIGLVDFPDVDGDFSVPAGPWFTWHEDRIELPAGVDVLMRNDNAIQLFRAGTAVGTQFHPEADTALVGMWTDVGSDHIPHHTSASELLSELSDANDVLDENCTALIDWFMRDVMGSA